ncbi:putative proton-dependent oligopeptide transporter family, major facilitator superfamily [Lupinus albus]|uniref:Putative proton-dependent oligopeptide transporter family, major facilitator superfamily n=1 Tax=Lupinus albus TaxID=3870 RepID=A0A6A4QXL4_LUPAL|nr:putative proton-dependent oligopeptide transporter family, major facilitator superfamily [Lupinus albus]
MTVVELIQSLVFMGNSMNLVRYFSQYMHYPVAQSSNMLTNFMGTSYLLTIVAGYINDTYLTKLTAFLLYVTIELLGVILLTYQAINSKLLPFENETPSTFQAAILYTGLGAMAIGIGGGKATLPTHGADQLDQNKQNLVSSFFTWYYMSVTAASILATTLMVWIEEHYGWNWSFTISAILLCCSITIFSSGFPLYRGKKPSGSPITRLTKVIVASTRKTIDAAAVQVYHNDKEQSYAKETSYNKFKFLNKALKDDTIEVSQVEDTKAFLGLLPIFATSIMLNCCSAQLMTFSVQQGNFMNRTIYNFTLTPQSISVIPLVVVLVLLNLLEQSKHFYGNNEAVNKIYQPLIRMGAGLAVSAASMAVAAIIEYNRLKEFNEGNIMSAFWLISQTLLVASSEITVVGAMLELFYSKAPNGMKSICTALTWCSSSMGYFLSSVLVTLCNSVSGSFGQAWIGGQDLNHDRLDYFYALLSFLSLLNFMAFVYFAKRF